MICGFLWDISMKNIDTNKSLWILAVLAAITMVVKGMIDGTKEITIPIMFDYLSVIVSVWSAFIFVFIKFIWKWKKLYKWLVKIPNLNGVWSGRIQTTYRDNKIINAKLEIVQTLFEVRCVLSTDESTSTSISCDFILESDTLNDKLSYVYRNEPSMIKRESSAIHYGSAILDINKDGLKGCYWTDRKTTGELYFEIEK